MNFPNFLKAISPVIEKNGRGVLNCIHILKCINKNYRLCFTNGHILIICDIPKDLVDSYCDRKPPLLYVKKFKTEKCFVLPKYADQKDEDFFPYPDLVGLFLQNMLPIYQNINTCFDYNNVQLFCKIRDVFNDNKPKTSKYFCPTHIISDGNSNLKIRVEQDILYGLMPLKSLYDLYPDQKEVVPINDFLPDLFTQKKIVLTKRVS